MNGSSSESLRGVSRREVIVALALALFLGGLLAPAILSQQEKSRRLGCSNNLRAIGLALHSYHDSFGRLPAAAIWHGKEFRTATLNEVKQIDRITYQNWAQQLLPFLDRNDVASTFHPDEPLMAEINERGRMTMVAEFRCPSDHFNRAGNPYTFAPVKDRPPIAEMARGNFAINGGTHSHRFMPESASYPRFDGLQMIASTEPRRFEFIGSGIAGINHSFSLSDFQNGISTLVAIEEVRSGIHPLDPRGVWSLGQIGGSITWAHGVSSDDCGPNNSWDRADDILGCEQLIGAVGKRALLEENMPCVNYVDRNDQATSRSLHREGVNVLFLDGVVRFVNNGVDRGLWHVMHSRETPPDVLSPEIIDQYLVEKTPPPEGAIPDAVVPDAAAQEMENSLGMKFVLIPGGAYEMGLPDAGNDEAPPPECPVHHVIVSNRFWMGQHEVSQKQFLDVMQRNPSRQAGDDRADFPVDSVTWNDAAEFCRKLTDRPEEKSCGRVYRLPTEAEWEYACRSGSTLPYVWSQTRHDDDTSGENSGMRPSLPITPIGSYRPNSFGLYDMRGNVWEWTADWFDRSYYSRSPTQDPQGPARGFIKVVRGGDWTFIGETCRINYPMMPPWKSSPYVGFRVVCTPSP